jgi:MFS transporter, putative metabolite:H+ symporter
MVNSGSDPSFQNKSKLQQLLQIPVIVAALGYFVDIYDLLLFSIVRIPSLKTLGIEGDLALDKGIFLLNVQMIGLLVGGIIWGIVGDKKGRLSVLFGSILLYSLANIANGFVTSLDQYAVLRFIAGVGLAGELGAGITLVAEILPKETRGYGTTLIATVGMFGAVLAYFISTVTDWQTAYWIGGGLGLVLLLLRVSVFESGMYKSLKEKKVDKGNFLMLFTEKKRFMKYLRCILIGLPIWYGIGILITLSPELGRALKLEVAINAGKAVMFSYIGLALGDLSSGLLSQFLKSRVKVVLLYISFTLLVVLIYLLFPYSSGDVFYLICVLLGFAVGYWALFVTIAAEQFGTNMRATVATSVPNFIRGTVVPITLLFRWADGLLGNIIYAALGVGILCIAIALWALSNMEETFGKDLNYLEKK